MAEWVCSKNDLHIWKARVSSRTHGGNGCPYCSGHKVLKGYNDLATTHPELEAEWAPKNTKSLYEVSAGSHYRAEWVCVKSNKHQWAATVFNRAQKDRGCPYCSNRKVLTGYNDLASTYPDLAKEWSSKNDISSTEIVWGSNKKALWECKLGHEYRMLVASRTRKGYGCPICSGQATLSGFNDLSTVYPEIAEQWSSQNALSPSNVPAGSGACVKLICSLGHTWENIVKDITRRGLKCPICMGRESYAGYNDLATTHPELAEEWSESNMILPTEITSRSHYRVEWVCKKNPLHVWEAVVNNRGRKTKPSGCPYCSSVVSKAEKEILEFITTLGLEAQKNRTLLRGKEIDIYIPEKNVAIEYNGVYWHSEDTGKDKWYHHNKWKDCKQQGVQLITIWEDDYERNPALIKRLIAHKLRVSDVMKAHARNTEIVLIVDMKQAREFYSENHIQGFAGGEHIGLVDKKSGELLALSTWRRQKKQGNQVRLERFATSQIIRGGFSKLLKYAVSRYASEGFSRIITFADHSVSDGSLYQSNGFVVAEELPPDYMYVVNDDRQHKFGYRLDRFRRDSELLFAEGLTEKQLAALNGIPRIWDCGKTRYVLELTHD